MGRGGLRIGCVRRTPGVAEVLLGESLSVERVHMRAGCGGGTLGGLEVGTV